MELPAYGVVCVWLSLCGVVCVELSACGVVGERRCLCMDLLALEVTYVWSCPCSYLRMEIFLCIVVCL